MSKINLLITDIDKFDTWDFIYGISTSSKYEEILDKVICIGNFDNIKSQSINHFSSKVKYFTGGEFETYEKLIIENEITHILFLDKNSELVFKDILDKGLCKNLNPGNNLEIKDIYESNPELSPNRLKLTFETSSRVSIDSFLLTNKNNSKFAINPLGLVFDKEYDLTPNKLPIQCIYDIVEKVSAKNVDNYLIPLDDKEYYCQFYVNGEYTFSRILEVIEDEFHTVTGGWKNSLNDIAINLMADKNIPKLFNLRLQVNDRFKLTILDYSQGLNFNVPHMVHEKNDLFYLLLRSEFDGKLNDSLKESYFILFADESLKTNFTKLTINNLF